MGTAQTANAAYGNDVIKPNAQTGTWGSQDSDAADDPNGHGIADFRANGLKQDGTGSGALYVGPGNNGQGVSHFGNK